MSHLNEVPKSVSKESASWIQHTKLDAITSRHQCFVLTLTSPCLFTIPFLLEKTLYTRNKLRRLRRITLYNGQPGRTKRNVRVVQPLSRCHSATLKHYMNFLPTSVPTSSYLYRLLHVSSALKCHWHLVHPPTETKINSITVWLDASITPSLMEKTTKCVSETWFKRLAKQFHPIRSRYKESDEGPLSPSSILIRVRSFFSLNSVYA